ncbi:MAG: response regulator [Verrucomicrobiota bacterium]
MAEQGRIILYVEDEESDRFLLERAFKALGFSSALRMVPDGRAAIHYLSGCGCFTDRNANPLPELVLLDLRIPEFSGFEVLEWIRRQPEYMALPVIIFSSSSRQDDRERAKLLTADDFWSKPSNALQYQGLVAKLLQKVNIIPSGPSSAPGSPQERPAPPRRAPSET